jgi:hypothetical protein
MHDDSLRILILTDKKQKIIPAEKRRVLAHRDDARAVRVFPRGTIFSPIELKIAASRLRGCANSQN